MDPPHVHAIVPDHHSTRLDLRRAPASTAISDAVPLLPFAMDRIAYFACTTCRLNPILSCLLPAYPRHEPRELRARVKFQYRFRTNGELMQHSFRNLAAALALSAAPILVAAQPVPIVGPVELSGAGATAGTNFDNGVKLAVKEINAAGGLSGRKIEYTSFDTQTIEKRLDSCRIVIVSQFVP